jgi:hypothetical protein
MILNSTDVLIGIGYKRESLLDIPECGYKGMTH